MEEGNINMTTRRKRIYKMSAYEIRALCIIFHNVVVSDHYGIWMIYCKRQRLKKPPINGFNQGDKRSITQKTIRH